MNQEANDAVEKAGSRVEQALGKGKSPDKSDATLVGDAASAPVPSGLDWLRGRAHVPEEEGDPKEAAHRETLWGDDREAEKG